MRTEACGEGDELSRNNFTIRCQLSGRDDNRVLLTEGCQDQKIENSSVNKVNNIVRN